MVASFITPTPTFPQLDGIFVLNKPSGPSSAQCLKIFKRMGQKKIGHAGTLDPLAKGVLVILLGQATKLSNWLMAKKIYSGVIRLGIETDTWDAEGKIIVEKSIGRIREKDIASEIDQWNGEHDQEVPPYSAAKFNGQPLYKLARKGCKTPLKMKRIKVFKAGMLNCNMPYINFRVECSSGSYIRSLAHSLGKRLGCGAALWELTRESSAPFSLSDACSMAELKENPAILMEKLHSLADALPEWPHIELSSAQTCDVRNGKSIPAIGHTANMENVLLCHNNLPVALARYEDKYNGPLWSIIRGLWN